MQAEVSPRILVVEDDAATAAGIVRGLKSAAFDVELSTGGTDGARRILSERFDAIVLDLMLPEQSGFDVLARVRHRTRAPVIVLTARTDLPDRLRAFELGAADFVAKPFWVEELVARIRSRLRLEDDRPKRVIRWQGVALDLDARTAEVEGKAAGLTPTEFAVLAYLIERPGRAVSRAVLAAQALASLEGPDVRTIDSHVARLRKKLGPGAAAIVTVWGIGYRFDPVESTE
ncbi:MAG TPA: response regulator transcription factor [Polyangiaceae bacterium]|nr:response regulator transcription factor [Polyangiaceae bacterium]